MTRFSKMGAHLSRLDRQLFRVSRNLELNDNLLPLNAADEEKRFLTAWRRGKKIQPRFRYPAFKVRANDLLLPISSVVFPDRAIKRLYEEKQDELILKWRMLKAIGTTRFSTYSRHLYGLPSKRIVSHCRSLLEKKTSVPFEESVKATEVRRQLAQFIKRHKLPWHTRISHKLSAKVTVRSVDRTLLVNRRLPFGTQEIERLKVHEIETHVYRGENGSRQAFKIFQIGLAHYPFTEEGIAVALEKRFDLLDPWQERAYTARCLAVHLAARHSFYKVFSQLVHYVPEALAFRIAVRAKRGLRDTARPGGLTKDHHYVSGSEAIRRRVRGQKNWEALFAGKVGLKNMKTVKQLIVKKVLRRPRYLPDIHNVSS